MNWPIGWHMLQFGVPVVFLTSQRSLYNSAACEFVAVGVGHDTYPRLVSELVHLLVYQLLHQLGGGISVVYRVVLFWVGGACACARLVFCMRAGLIRVFVL